MTTSRRKFLSILGGGTVLAATAGAATFLSTRTPNSALAPWQQAGQYSDARKRALSYAILAPNPHNRQPWLVDLSRDDTVVLLVDTGKMLPHTDPFNRQICIGLGCFLEVFRMAAAADGYHVQVNSFPQGYDKLALDHRPIAEIKLSPDATLQSDALFEQVLLRQTLKEPYDTTRPVPASVLSDLLALQQSGVHIGTSGQTEQVQSIRQLCHQAMAVEIETPHTYKESVDLFRIGKREIEANPDGIDFGGPVFDTLAALGMFSRELALDTQSSGYSQGIKAVLDNIDSAMAFVWLTTNGNTRQDQLNAGRDWIRINLQTTALGIAVQPLSQALQEYPEMQSHYRDIHRQLNAEGGTVQMLGRLGYGAAVAQSPRWPIESKIV